MENGLFQYLLVNISLLVLVAAVLTELAPLRRLLKKQRKSLPEQLCLGVIFGLLSVSGTYTGLSLQGAVVNTRVVSTLAAGLVGGPLPGLCAGLMGGRSPAALRPLRLYLSGLCHRHLLLWRDRGSGLPETPAKKGPESGPHPACGCI